MIRLTESNYPLKAKKTWRLVVSDLDGTLLDDQNKVSDENQAAVAELASQNIGFTLATGRPDLMTRTYVKQLGIQFPVIACNGTIIRDCSSEEILYRQNLLAEDTLELIQWLTGRQLDFLCYTPEGVYFPRHSKRIGKFYRYNLDAAQTGVRLVPTGELEGQEIRLAEEGLLKIMVVVPSLENYNDVQAKLEQMPDCAGIYSMSDAMDINFAGITKGSGLRKLAEILQIEASEIVAIGDNDNDIPLVSQTGLGIAMGNATPALKAACSHVTTSNTESGLAEAIRRHILFTK